VEDHYIRAAIRMQADLFLQAVTDGGYRRAFWHDDFLAGLDSVEMVEVATGMQFSGGAPVRPVAPAVTSRLDYTTGHEDDDTAVPAFDLWAGGRKADPGSLPLPWRKGRATTDT